MLAKVFETVQKFNREGTILAYHDRCEGGVACLRVGACVCV